MWAIVNDPFDPAAMAEVYGPSTGETAGFPREPLGAFESVNGAELRPEVAQERLRVEAAADHALEQVLRHELAAVPADVLPEPSAEFAELACPPPVLEIRQAALDALP